MSPAVKLNGQGANVKSMFLVFMFSPHCGHTLTVDSL
jgi:hypothetical protein